jgi:preprotein translocase subunit SecY
MSKENPYEKFDNLSAVKLSKKPSRFPKLRNRLSRITKSFSGIKPLKRLGDILGNKDIMLRIGMTLFVVILYRGLSNVPLPGIDMQAYLQNFGSSTASEGSYLFSIFTGGQLETPSIVGLGLAAYINASIIMQLLPYAVNRLKELQKEGERGRQVINQITRFLTVPLSLLYSSAYLLYLSQRDLLNPNADPSITADPNHVPLYLIPHADGSDWPTAQKIIFMAIALTAGTMLLMWLSELITEKGLGNGSSVIITVGILASLPNLIGRDLSQINLGETVSQVLQGNFTALTNPLTLSILGVIVGFIVVIASIIFINSSERKIDIQYARRARGNEIGKGSFLPIKFTITGVLPVIFATSLLSIPQIIVPILRNTIDPAAPFQNFLSSLETSFLYAAQDNIVDSRDSTYIVVYFFLVLLFSLFYSFIVLNPQETAENLQKSGAFVPGIRPGKSTENYISKVLLRIAFVGGIILALIALVPLVSRDLILSSTGRQIALLSGIGGTSILIIVSVILDTMRQYQSLKATRSYERYV